MKITDLISKQTVRVPLAATNKMAAIRELVELLRDNGELGNFETVLEAVQKRERKESTAIGYGLAVPHAKSPAVGKLAVAIGKPAAPMDFESRDRLPCHLLVLLVSPENASQSHIKTLADISRLWRIPAFRDAVAAAQTGDELVDAFRRFEP